MKTTDKQSDKRKAIMEASLKLFCEKCFQDTSTASISQAASVGTGTLFCYFDSKEDLVNALYLESKEELAAFVEDGVWDHSTFKAQLMHVFDRRIQWYTANPEKIKFMMQYHSSKLITEATRERVVMKLQVLNEIVTRAVNNGEVTTASIDFLAALISGYFHNAGTYIAENASKEDLKKWQEEAFNMLWKGLN